MNTNTKQEEGMVRDAEREGMQREGGIWRKRAGERGQGSEENKERSKRSNET